MILSYFLSEFLQYLGGQANFLHLFNHNTCCKANVQLLQVHSLQLFMDSKDKVSISKVSFCNLQNYKHISSFFQRASRL